MTTTDPLALVFGAGGLLGSAVSRHLGGRSLVSGPRYTWSDHSRLRDEAHESLEHLLSNAGDLERPWTVYWCAGLGHVSAPDRVLAADEAALHAVLEVVGELRPRTPGSICFASSAGALYAGSAANPASEDTATATMSEYGRSKLRQEALISETVEAVDGVRGLLARISNLYGPGQNADKPQGLITTVIRNTLDRRPTNIYVPLDTARDYLHTRSAALMLTALNRHALDAPPGTTLTRLVAAERTTSISQIIGTVARVLRRRVPFVVAERPEARLQPVVSSFRSIDRTTHLIDTITLEEGLASLIADVRFRQAARA